MKYFLDSAITGEIAYALDMYNIDGVTTNPRHVAGLGQAVHGGHPGDRQDVCRHGQARVGRGQPAPDRLAAPWWLKDEKLAALCPNFVIKLPATEPGFKSVPVLAEKGIRANLTLVFSASQALQAMRMGAAFVSPFIGWKESNGEDVGALHRGCCGDPRQLRLRDARSSSRRCATAARSSNRPSPARISSPRGWRCSRMLSTIRTPHKGLKLLPGLLGSDEVRVMRET